MTGREADEFIRRRMAQLRREDREIEEALARGVVISREGDGTVNFVTALPALPDGLPPEAARSRGAAWRILMDGALGLAGATVRLDDRPAGFVPPFEARPRTRPLAPLRQTYGACSAVTRAGEPCRATASVPGFCGLHDPEQKRRRAASKGSGGSGKAAAKREAARADKEAQEAAALAERRAAAEAARAERRAARDARRSAEREPFAGQCVAVTKSGRRCRLTADGDDGRCALHRV